MRPRFTFKFSYIVGAIYAIEMMMEAHLVKTKVKHNIQVFSQELLESYRREFSLSSFLWHLRPLIATTQDIMKALNLYYSKEIAPLLYKAIESYKPHWQKILPKIKENTRYLMDFWKKHGNVILNEISNISRHPWKVEEIKAFIVEPIAEGHGDAFPREGIITFEGIKLTTPESIVGFVHEVAHINTLPPFIETLEQKDIRSKVLYEIANEYVAEQALVNIKVLPSLNSPRLQRIFAESVEAWMTESELKFTYDPEKLKRIVDKWWINHLKSSETLLSSFKKLEKKALPHMKIKRPTRNLKIK